MKGVMPTKEHRKRPPGRLRKGAYTPKQWIWAPFGILRINVSALQEGVLSVKYLHTHGNHTQFKSTHISPDFKEWLLMTLETGRSNPYFVKRMSIDDLALMKKLVHHSKADLKLDGIERLEEDEKKQLERLQLLVGEKDAGNNNNDLMREALTILVDMKARGRLSNHEFVDFQHKLLTSRV